MQAEGRDIFPIGRRLNRAMMLVNGGGGDTFDQWGWRREGSMSNYIFPGMQWQSDREICIRLHGWTEGGKKAFVWLELCRAFTLCAKGLGTFYV